MRKKNNFLLFLTGFFSPIKRLIVAMLENNSGSFKIATRRYQRYYLVVNFVHEQMAPFMKPKYLYNYLARAVSSPEPDLGKVVVSDFGAGPEKMKSQLAYVLPACSLS